MANALYTVYFTGAAGKSIALFYVGSGLIEGIDVGGMKYSGTYQETQTGEFTGVVTFTVPPNTSLITGLSAGPNPISIPVPMTLPANFGDGQSFGLIRPQDR